jgi:hypothetical protein
MSGDHDVGRPRAWTRWWAAAVVLTNGVWGTSKPAIPLRRNLRAGEPVKGGNTSIKETPSA